MDIEKVFQTLGLRAGELEKGPNKVYSPIDGQVLGGIHFDTTAGVEKKISQAVQCFKTWRIVPPPHRGELIRLLGEELRTHKEALGTLITLETGKILQEGLGEVQEAIDMCDFAVGLSRQLYGLTIASERPNHRMMETWHPLGPIGIITPFNFPLAIWAWNFTVALVCGDPVLWKPSEKTPLIALAATKLFEKALQKYKNAPEDLLQIVLGERDLGKLLVSHKDLPLISATGSTVMGKAVAQGVATRLGRYLLELSGNNAMILAPSADLDLASRAIAFAAFGTTGQRCTSLRRLIVHESLSDKVLKRLQNIYAQVKVGNPLEPQTQMGPLIDGRSFDAMQQALEKAGEQGGKVTGGERVLQDVYPQAYYVNPALVVMSQQTAIVREETFAPILYLIPYRKFDEALIIHNDVSQGLASSIFTNDVREAETFLSNRGSDCGIVNVNIGPSGAEIGGAFGGEKDTGGGREAGSDSWKAYMRRATNTINYSSELPLAQGIKFDVGEG